MKTTIAIVCATAIAIVVVVHLPTVALATLVGLLAGASGLIPVALLAAHERTRLEQRLAEREAETQALRARLQECPAIWDGGDGEYTIDIHEN